MEKMHKKTDSVKGARIKNFICFIGVALFVGLAIFWLSKMPEMHSSVVPEKGTTSKELLKVNKSDWTKGNKNSSVVLIEYLDFECEACGAYYPLVKQLSEEYKNDVLFVSRYFPLPGHKNGLPAALAVEAAGKQGKFWEMYNLLFENQTVWGEKPASDPTIFENYAKELGLDTEKFKQDVSSDEVKNRVSRDRDSGTQLGVNGTPSFFLNGLKVANPKSPTAFKALIQSAVEDAR